MIDRVQPLKIESTSSGGEEVDEFPTALDRNEDYVDCRGVTLQNTTSNDALVRAERTADGDLQFLDLANPTPVTLTDLVAGTGGVTETSHKVLRQLIHFIDDGPAEGFLSGAYRETTPSGDPFPTSVVWWESAAKLKKIVEKTITRSGGGATNVAPTPIVWKVYDVDGSTVLATVSDAVSYTGPFETNRTRTITT